MRCTALDIVEHAADHGNLIRVVSDLGSWRLPSRDWCAMLLAQHTGDRILEFSDLQSERGGEGRRELLVLPDWVTQHVTGGVGGYEFTTQLIQWGAIIVRNCNDIALRMAHAWYFFVEDDGLAITD